MLRPMSHPSSPPPRLVHAIQWFPGRYLPGLGAERPGHPGGPGLLPTPPHAYLATPRGRLTVLPGDWVVTEPRRPPHVCPDHLFRQRYFSSEGTPGHRPHQFRVAAAP